MDAKIAIKLRTATALGENFLQAVDILVEVDPTAVPRQDFIDLKHILARMTDRARGQGYIGRP